MLSAGLLMAAAGCAGSDDDRARDAAVFGAVVAADEGAVSSSAVSSSAASGAAAPSVLVPASEASTAASAEPGEGAQLTVSGVRIAHHDGYDRVVVDLGGTGTPGWDVSYVDAAADPGTGKVLQLPGSAVLQVGISGAGYPYATGVSEYSSRAVLTAAGTTAVAGVRFVGTYEGTSTAFIGTNGQAPFRVSALSGPTRVVIDVVDGS